MSPPSVSLLGFWLGVGLADFDGEGEDFWDIVGEVCVGVGVGENCGLCCRTVCLRIKPTARAIIIIIIIVHKVLEFDFALRLSLSLHHFFSIF